MAFETPKTNWQAADAVSKDDMNRIEGNEVELKEQADTIQQDLQAHEESSTAHGTESAVVGVSDQQVLQNKTLGTNTKLDADLNANDKKITNLGAPTLETDAARKLEVDSVQNNLATHVSSTQAHGTTSTLVGAEDTQTITNKTLGTGTKLGADLDANGKRITNLAAPTTGADAARKQEVDAVQGNLTTHMAAKTVHGISGEVVGTTDAQTVTNKTLGTGTKLGADLDAN
ncbi:MAG TPA: hypothetical protein PK317_00010, partial [Coprothermobacter proteolyticus]|nr:hypothetical protein [Coprothermobacter proteolyticus]